MTETGNKIIEVGIAEVKFASSPDVLTTRGLGSCVGIVMYDPVKKYGGLAHPMLPDINKTKIRTNPAKFVNSVIEIMLDELKKHHSSVVEAKIFGGAHMFSAIPADSAFNIGVKNVTMAKEILNRLGVKLVGEDTGENFGRTLSFDLETGKVTVKTIFQGVKVV